LQKTINHILCRDRIHITRLELESRNGGGRDGQGSDCVLYPVRKY